MKVEKNRVVHFHYTVSDRNGALLDSTEGFAPAGYLHGAGNLMAGLEDALEGMEAGEERSCSLVAEPGSFSSKQQELCFNIKITDVRAATSTEMAVGYPVHPEHDGCDPGCKC